MSLEDLSDVFRNVHACLQQGGLFLFDLNMAEGYKARWWGSLGIVEDDHVCDVRASFNEEERVERTAITVFRSEGASWHCFDVALLQRCYTGSEIQSALAPAGFGNIQTFDAAECLGMVKRNRENLLSEPEDQDKQWWRLTSTVAAPPPLTLRRAAELGRWASQEWGVSRYARN